MVRFSHGGQNLAYILRQDPPQSCFLKKRDQRLTSIRKGANETLGLSQVQGVPQVFERGFDRSSRQSL
jgi:hypothetical protein